MKIKTTIAGHGNKDKLTKTLVKPPSKPQPIPQSRADKMAKQIKPRVTLKTTREI